MGDKEKMQKEGAKTAVEDAMKNCMKTAKSKAARDNCQKDQKAALAQALGRNVTATEVNKYNERAAEDAVRKSMSVCTAAATTDADKYACQQTAKEQLATALGKTANETSDQELQKYLKGGAKKQLESEMDSCVKRAGTNKAERALCRSNTAKDALKSSLGRNVTNTELELFLEDAA